MYWNDLLPDRFGSAAFTSDWKGLHLFQLDAEKGGTSHFFILKVILEGLFPDQVLVSNAMKNRPHSLGPLCHCTS